MTFFDSAQCFDGPQCETCRSIAKGKRFRASICSAHSDVDSEDFTCPKGKPWIKANVQLVGGKVFLEGKECVPCSKKDKVK